MNLYLDLDFVEHFAKDKFFFGVANAPYLCEGGFNTPNGPKNSFGYFEAQGKVPPSGETTRYWENYLEHIELSAKLGLTAFRTGVEWARIQPTTELAEGPAPAWDSEVVDRYADIMAEIQKHNMEPVVTLHHFTHPAWLGEVFWLRDDSADLATAFELRIVEELNDRLLSRGLEPLGHFITFNELNLLPWKVLVGSLRVKSAADVRLESFEPVFDNVLLAHVQVYDGLKKLYHDRGWNEPLIGFGTATQSPYEFDKLMLDMVRVRSSGTPRSEAKSYFDKGRTQWNSRLSGLAKRQLTDKQFAFWEEELALTKRTIDGTRMVKTLDAIYSSADPVKLDYISANVYEPFRNARAAGDPGKSPQWWEFAADGDIYRTMILAYNDGNTNLPMFMGENSLAYEQPTDGEAVTRPDGWTRERYLKTYFMEIIRCIAEGVPIRGYLYWSLVDDFEWDAGFSPRLGLYNYDYVNHKIRETDGRGEPAGDIYAHLIHALRSGDKAVIRESFVNSYLSHQVIK